MSNMSSLAYWQSKHEGFMNNLQWQEVKGEKSRTYHFANGNQTLTINEVTKLCVRPSGNHRLETASGKKFIVRDWVAIEIEAERWDF
jgi:hypothetical protein